MTQNIINPPISTPPTLCGVAKKADAEAGVKCPRGDLPVMRFALAGKPSSSTGASLRPILIDSSPDLIREGHRCRRRGRGGKTALLRIRGAWLSRSRSNELASIGIFLFLVRLGRTERSRRSVGVKNL